MVATHFPHVATNGEFAENILALRASEVEFHSPEEIMWFIDVFG